MNLSPAESGARVLFGKPYHWAHVAGALQLQHGEAPDPEK